MRLDEIKVGLRFRKDMGDVQVLADSIREIGLLHPVVVTANGELLAGARRLAAARLLGWDEVPVHVVNLTDLLRGELDENTIRKDFTPTERAAIADALLPALQEKAREREQTHTDAGWEKFSDAEKGRAKDQAAKLAGMSRPTYEKIKAVEVYGDAEIIAEMDRTGHVDRAYREVVKRQHAALPAPELPPGKYRVIYADPPWEYSDKLIEGYGAAEHHYPAMSTDELCAMEVQKSAADGAVLFLWVTAPMLGECFPVIAAWGFQYRASFVWDKVLHNYGHYNSVRHELLLICTRGSWLPEIKELYDSVQTIQRSQTHSEKPEQFRAIIEAMYPTGPRLELFARKEVPGWSCWGDEVAK